MIGWNVEINQFKQSYNGLHNLLVKPEVKNLVNKAIKIAKQQENLHK